MAIQSPEQPQGPQGNWPTHTPYTSYGSGEDATEAPGGFPGAGISPNTGQEIPPQNIQDTPPGIAYYPENLTPPSSTIALTPEEKHFWTKPRRIGTAIGTVLALGITGTVVGIMEKHDNSRGVVDLTAVAKNGLTLDETEKSGDFLPKVPVYLGDPDKNPVAFMISTLANFSYAMATTNDGYANYALNNLTTVPDKSSQFKAMRKYWRTSRGGELESFWSNGPVDFKVTKNSDGSETESLASGEIYFDAIQADPDKDGWTVIRNHPAISKSKMTKFSVTFRRWPNSGTQNAITGIYRDDIIGMQTGDTPPPSADRLVMPIAP